MVKGRSARSEESWDKELADVMAALARLCAENGVLPQNPKLELENRRAAEIFERASWTCCTTRLTDLISAKLIEVVNAYREGDEGLTEISTAESLCKTVLKRLETHCPLGDAAAFAHSV